MDGFATHPLSSLLSDMYLALKKNFVMALLVSANLCIAATGSNIVARVNGVELTKKQFDDDVELRMHFMRKKRVNENYLAKYEARQREILKKTWVNSILLKKEAERLGIKPTAKDRELLEKKYLKVFKKRRQGFKRFRESIVKAGLGEAFDRNFNLELIANSYIESRFKKEVTISDKDIDSAIKRMEAYNTRASLTNDVIAALASNICARAKKGEDFSRLADKYSQEEDRKPGGYQGICTDGDFSGEEPVFARTIWALKDGEISDVLDTGDSYTIVKMIKHVAKESQDDPPSCEIAWIKLFRPQFYSSYTRKEIMEMGIKQQREKIFKSELERLRKNAKIEFPSLKQPTNNKPRSKGAQK